MCLLLYILFACHVSVVLRSTSAAVRRTHVVLFCPLMSPACSFRFILVPLRDGGGARVVCAVGSLCALRVSRSHPTGTVWRDGKASFLCLSAASPVIITVTCALFRRVLCASSSSLCVFGQVLSRRLLARGSVNRFNSQTTTILSRSCGRRVCLPTRNDLFTGGVGSNYSGGGGDTRSCGRRQRQAVQVRLFARLGLL